MTTSKIWTINNRPVVADTIEDAIASYKAHCFINSKEEVVDAHQIVFDNYETCIISNNVSK